jgi:hypothetical protein
LNKKINSISNYRYGCIPATYEYYF